MKVNKILGRALPANAKDPAAQFGNIRSAKRNLDAAYARIKSGVQNLIDTFEPKLVSNVATYEYLLDANRYQNINQFLKDLLYQELLGDQGGFIQGRYILFDGIDQAHSDGLTDAVIDAKEISDPNFVEPEVDRLVRALDADQIKFSPGYQRRVGLVHSRLFNEMKGLADSSKIDLADTLARGMSAGKGVREIAQEVKERIDASGRRALRIARTEILNAYRDAGAAETDELNRDVYDDSDWGMIQLWFSALAPTSRAWHISRHGETYTTKEVRDFYAEKGNSINCLCSQSAVLYNKKTGEILQSDLVARLRRQKKAFSKLAA